MGHRETILTRSQLSRKQLTVKKKCIEHSIFASFLSTAFVRNIFRSDKYLGNYGRVKH
jgi:hypothetical protein